MAKIVCMAHTSVAQTPVRRYYALAESGRRILRMEDAMEGTRFTIECDSPEEYCTIRGWNDAEWGRWLEQDRKLWLQR